jgi:hypothetical protein
LDLANFEATKPLSLWRDCKGLKILGGACSGLIRGDKITGKIIFPNNLRIVAMKY